MNKFQNYGQKKFSSHVKILYMGKSARDFDLGKNISDIIFLRGTLVWVTDFQSMGRLEHDSIREQRGSSPVTIVLEVFPFFKFKLKWPLF